MKLFLTVTIFKILQNDNIESGARSKCPIQKEKSKSKNVPNRKSKGIFGYNYCDLDLDIS